MNCIGDECAHPGSTGPGKGEPTALARLLSSVAIGGLCACVGYQLAALPRKAAPSDHVAAFAAPMVFVSQISAE